MTVTVSSPRFNTKNRLRSDDITAYTGQWPTAMGGSAVLLATSMGLAEPSGAVRGDELQVIGAASATFWLRTYSRWPVRVGGPKTETGRVLASGMASLKTC